MQRLTHTQLAQLVKSAQAGDESAFAALYAATVDSQMYFANTILQDPYLAEDAVQMTYTSFYTSLSQLKTPRLLVAYLNRICYNTCMDILKKTGRYQKELGEGKIDLSIDGTLDHNPEQCYLAREQNDEIIKALSALPEQRKAMFLMRYYHEMKIKEIAIALDISQSTVKRGLKDSLAKLKPVLIERQRRTTHDQ